MVASYEVSIQESALLYVAETYKTLYPEGILIFSCQNPVSPAVMFFWEAVLNTKKFLVESRSLFSWYLAVPRLVLTDHINLVVAVGKQNDHSGITGTVKNKTDCISGGHSRHLGCVITCDYDCQSYRASICVGCYATGNIVTDIQAGFQVTILRCYSQINTHSKT